jgi:hypothetical protein
VLVTDHDIRAAQEAVWNTLRVVAEPRAPPYSPPSVAEGFRAASSDPLCVVRTESAAR